MTTAIELAIKMLGEKQKTSFINEELTPAHQRKADKMVKYGHDYHQEQFILDHAAPNTLQKFQYDKDTGHKVIRIPINLNQDNPDPSHTVKDFIEDKGYLIKDISSYRQGIVHKNVVTGNPEKGIPYKNKLVPHKIGTVLEKHGAPFDVTHAYQHDPVRVGTGKKDYDLVISNHPHDVYGMSTGRGWTSCADMENPKGAAAKEMDDEINNHTHVAYLVDRGGDYNKNAIARIAFKHYTATTAKSDQNPHINHQTLISEKRVYGQAPTDFRSVAEGEMKKIFPIKDDVYMKNPNVYNDNGELVHVPEGKSVSAESLVTAWKKFPAESKHQLYEYVGLDGKYKSKKLREVQGALKDIMQEPSGNFQEDISRVRHSTYDLDNEQKLAGIGRNNVIGRDTLHNQMNKVMKSFDVSNPDHQMELRLFGFDHPLRNHVFHGVEKSIPPIRTPADFIVGNKIHTLLGSRGHEHLPVHPDHMLGDDPVKTLGQAGVLHDVNDFRKAYHTFSHLRNEKENWYSMAHRLNAENVPNAHHALNDSINTLKGYRDNGYRGEMSLASSFLYMSPAARVFYGKELGIDHDALMEKHKDYLEQYN